MIRTFIFLFLLLGCIAVRGETSYIFNRLSTADGLNTNKVNCVWQDKKGFLWIGTENGLQRFDGRKFINFRTDGTKRAIPPYGVDQILDAGDGKIWFRQQNMIGTFDLATFSYQSVRILPHKPLPTLTEMQLNCDSKENTFLCIRKYGLLFYDNTQNAFIENNLPIKVPEGWPVHSLFEDSITGDYWISSDRGLGVYHSKKQTLVYPGQNPEHISFFDDTKYKFIYNFFIDKQRTWWVFYWEFSTKGEGSFVIHYDPATGKIINTLSRENNDPTNYTELNWVFETKQGQIWLGGTNNLLTYDQKTNEFVQHKKPEPAEFDLKCREIKSIFEDRENNIWLCTENGLYVTNASQKNVFNMVLVNHKKGDDVIVNSILETKNLENWVGTWGRGILIFNKHFKKTDFDLYANVAPEKRQSVRMVWNVLEHSPSGNIWSGCQNGFVAVFNPLTRKTVALLQPPVFEHAIVRQIAEDKDGNLLFGTQNGRLAKWKNNTEINNRNFELVRDFHATIFKLYRDSANRIWVGTRNNGVFVMDPSGKNVLFRFSETPEKKESLMGASVFDIEQLNDSIFFVSTGFLNIINLNSGKVKALTPSDGVPGGNVMQLLKDGENMIWFTHNNGLGSYNYEKNIFAAYNERNGVIMAEKEAYAKYKMQNGEIWFGGENSLFGFRPEALKFKNAPPDVTITDFKVFNKFIPLDSLRSRQEILLNPEQNSFTFYFSSLSFTQQDKLIYYYKLDGVDRDWIKAERDLAANYTTLKPGHYVFNVKCINMQGNESVNATLLPITILPHFYQTGWFSMLIILLAGFLTYFIYRLRLNKLLAVERVRNKVARDLHDDVGSTLSTINILSTMAKTKLLTDPVKTSEYLTKITENSQHMMESMDDIVWSIKPDNDNMQKIVARMREYSSGILEPKDVEIYFRTNGNINDLKLNMETRRDLFLIFKEAINNVAKYAHCTRVDVHIRHESKKLLLTVSDNGKGFNLKLADSGNGLGNMQKRAEALGGVISIKSSEESGTEISLEIPVND